MKIIEANILSSAQRATQSAVFWFFSYYRICLLIIYLQSLEKEVAAEMLE